MTISANPEVSHSAIQSFSKCNSKTFSRSHHSLNHILMSVGNPATLLASYPQSFCHFSRFLTSPCRRPTRQHRHQNGKSKCRCPRIPQKGTPRYASALLDDSPTLEAGLAHLQGRKSPTACPDFFLSENRISIFILYTHINTQKCIHISIKSYMFPVNFALILMGGIPYPFIHLSLFRQTQIYPVYLVFPYSNYTVLNCVNPNLTAEATVMAQLIVITGMN